MSAAVQAALLIAIDTIDLAHSFRNLAPLSAPRPGCARCGKPRDAFDRHGQPRSCCQLCLDAMKLYRVYGAEPARPSDRSRPPTVEVTGHLVAVTIGNAGVAITAAESRLLRERLAAAEARIRSGGR